MALRISVGSSRKSLKWKQIDLEWEDLVEKLSIPTRTQESVDEYKALPKSKKDELKDVGGFVGGSLSDERRKSENVISRSLITLDLDSVPKGTDIWSIVEDGIDVAAALYSTHSSTENNPRLRLIMPLKREVTPDEYEAVARKIAEYIGIDFCDDTTFEASRLMYWPSCPHNAEYIFKENKASFLDPDEVLAEYDDWKNVSSWPVSSRREKLDERRAKKQGNPLEKDGVIGAFCKTYDIPDAIEKFLPDVYKPTAEKDRFSYVKGSTVGGLVLYQDGLFAYSHHSTDPIEGKLVNSFDLVRLHLFGDLDDEEVKQVNQLPSYKKMIDFALKDEAVSYQLAVEQVDNAFEEADIKSETEDDSKDWLKSLKMTAKGAIANTINNIVLILLHDERLKGSYYYDSFKERPIVSGDLPWVRYKDRISDNWIDTDDAGLRRFLELHYQIDTPQKIRDAVDLAMIGTIKHPVREYLESLEWDGVERVETLFIDYLGAEDTHYVRAVTRKSLIGAVARILKPGCKHDHTLVLVGPQGCGKSMTLTKLGKEWYSDSLYTMAGKEAYEQLQGYWIIELSEMAATRKAEVEQIKQFISKTSDNYRAAYARRTQEHLRQCCFFGSTNDSDFLRDYTGARRFWPVVVSSKGKNLCQKLTEDLVDMIWAEAVAYYKKGEQWYLPSDIEKEAKQVQRDHTEINGKQGLIENFIEKKIPKDWSKRDLPERLMFWSGDFDEIEDEDLEEREAVCAIEIWCECFGGDPKQYTQTQAREIGNMLKNIDGWSYQMGISAGKPYGRQRGYIREDLLE